MYIWDKLNRIVTFVQVSVAVGALALLEKAILQLVNMIIFHKYTESFYLAATVNSLFQGFIMLSMKSYIVNGKHRTQTNPLLNHHLWMHFGQLFYNYIGEVQHFIKH